MKAILKLIGYLFIGACVGLIFVIPIIAVIDGVSFTSAARGVFSKFSLSDVAFIIWMLIAVVIAFFLNIVIHEGGHLVAERLAAARGQQG